MTSQKLEECQQNADEVKILMKDNVDKIFEREGKLENLELRSTELQNMAMNFQKTAHKVERKTYWEKWRWRIIFGIIIFAILVIIIAVTAFLLSGGEAAPSSAEGATEQTSEHERNG